MSAIPDFVRLFRDLERRLEAEPDEVTAEIARGVYLMTPRPRARHGGAQARLAHVLEARFGSGSAADPPDWLFVVEPELRSEAAFSRLVPDLAGWRRSGSGWPDLDRTPVELMPEWVAEGLSPSNERRDREAEVAAYGTMGVGWLWLLDADARMVETFENRRGRMVPLASFDAGSEVHGPPFSPVGVPVGSLFV